MITVHITRGDAEHGTSHIDVFTYDGNMTITVADYLTLLNRDKALRTDVNGEVRPPVIWDCGCLEGKCGACAMVINGVPRLACRSFLDKVGRRGSITIRPLSKFPLIRDLSVNKDKMFETLKKRQIWTEKAVISEDTETRNLIYKSGQCLECGCCLEVCPNFKGVFDERGDNAFPGPIYAVETYRADRTSDDDYHRHKLHILYNDLFYENCDNSMGCKAVCPAKIPHDELQARLNSKKRV